MHYSALALKLQGGRVLETCLTAASFISSQFPQNRYVCVLTEYSFLFLLSHLQVQP